MLKRGVRFWFAPLFLDIPVSSFVATKSPPLEVVSNEVACFFAKHYLWHGPGAAGLPFSSTAGWAGHLGVIPAGKPHLVITEQ